MTVNASPNIRPTTVEELIKQVRGEDYVARAMRFKTKLRNVVGRTGMPMEQYPEEYATTMLLLGPMISELNSRQIAKMVQRALALHEPDRITASHLEANERTIAMQWKALQSQSEAIQSLAAQVGVKLSDAVKLDKDTTH